MTNDQIKHMVDRFLSWKLPDNFNPDGGVSFKAEFNENTPWPMRHEPSGTNLLDYTQAEAMVRHMLEGLPDAAEARTVGGDMSPEELDEARMGEAQKFGYDAAGALYYYRKLVRTGWTPPKVEGVDPDLVVVREIAARVVEREAVGIGHPYARDIRAGKKDGSTEVQIARAILAYLKGDVE